MRSSNPSAGLVSAKNKHHKYENEILDLSEENSDFGEINNFTDFS